MRKFNRFTIEGQHAIFWRSEPCENCGDEVCAPNTLKVVNNQAAQFTIKNSNMSRSSYVCDNEIWPTDTGYACGECIDE